MPFSAGCLKSKKMNLRVAQNPRGEKKSSKKEKKSHDSR
jgi:hypothetical protein